MRITNDIQRQQALRELKSLQDKGGLGKITLQDRARSNELDIELIQYKMTIEANRSKKRRTN